MHTYRPNQTQQKINLAGSKTNDTKINTKDREVEKCGDMEKQTHKDQRKT